MSGKLHYADSRLWTRATICYPERTALRAGVEGSLGRDSSTPSVVARNDMRLRSVR